MALRYITVEEFLDGQSGVLVEIGDGKCFRSVDHLIFFLSAIEEMVDNYLGRRLNLGNYTDRFWGSGSWVRQTKVYPIRSVEEISYITVGSTSQVISPDDYLVCEEMIKLPATFNRDLYYTINYTAGWEINEIPFVIKQAIIEQAGLTLLEHPRGVLKSESGNNSKLVFEQTPLPLWPQIEQKLRPYKRNNLFL